VLAPDAAGRRRIRRVAVARTTVSLRGACRLIINYKKNPVMNFKAKRLGLWWRNEEEWWS